MNARFYGSTMVFLVALIALTAALKMLTGHAVISLGAIIVFGVIVLLAGMLCWTVLRKTHLLIRSAEWELMESAVRVERGVQSRVKKQEEKLEYFSRLSHQTASIYTGPAQAGGHLVVGDLPNTPFKEENMELLNSQHNEMEKIAKRKAKVRLNAALLRELLYGTELKFSGYHARTIKLTADERAMIMGTIEVLSKADANLVWFAAKLHRHPGNYIYWSPLELSGRKALEYLCSF